MSCDYTHTALHGYLDGELDASRSAEFERHLEGCRECAKALETQESLRSILRRSGLCESAPNSLRKKIRAELDARTSVPITERDPGVEVGSRSRLDCSRRGDLLVCVAGIWVRNEEPCCSALHRRGTHRRAHPLAAARAPHRRCFDRSAHGEAVVQREAGLRAAGERLCAGRFSPGWRTSGRVGRPKRCGARLWAAKALHQCFCVAHERAGHADSSARAAAGIPMAALASSRDGVLRGIRRFGRGLARARAAHLPMKKMWPPVARA